MKILGQNEKAFFKYYKMLANKIINKDFVLNYDGSNVVELLFPVIKLNPLQTFLNFGIRQTDEKYFAKELNWYLSQTCNIKGRLDKIKIWNEISDNEGNVNSNYGNLVFSKDNNSQYNNVKKCLVSEKRSRQAIIIYQRPSMHEDWKVNNMRDFVCTNFQHFMIRKNKLICITSMRSQDCWYGTFNDIPWFHYVFMTLFNDLKNSIYVDLQVGKHVFIPNSFHCYEKQFQKLLKMIKYVKENYKGI